MKKKILWILLCVVAVTVTVLLFRGIKGGRWALNIKSAGSSGLAASAKALEEKNDLLAAKNAYQKLITDYPNSSQLPQWEKKIEELNIKILFSPLITKGSALYEIKPADNLTKIAQKFNTTVELIMKENNLASDKIIPGKKIKVCTQTFNILVDKSQNILILKSNEEVVKIYVVSTGKNNCTPTGNFKIVSKLQNPTWFKAGAVVPAGSPENVLGTRWLGIDLRGYGIHGTTEPQSLGTQATQGCVRISNQEVEELYAIVPLKTEVVVVD